VITAAQAQSYLDQALGVGVPAFLVELAITKVATAEAAMDAAGYSETDKTLIQLIAVTLIASLGAPRRITSQHAPSGASRSFQYGKGDLTALYRLLASLDTAGTVTGLVPPDPATSTLFMVVC